MASATLFTAADQRDLVALARAIYPHDDLADAPYRRTTLSIEERAAADPALYRELQNGLKDLRRESNTALSAVAATTLQHMLRDRELSPFFQTLRSLVAWYLYDDREVWEFIGYPGAAFELGGYLHRGFDDLTWLPEPRIDEPAEPIPDIGPLLEKETSL